MEKKKKKEKKQLFLLAPGHWPPAYTSPLWVQGNPPGPVFSTFN